MRLGAIQGNAQEGGCSTVGISVDSGLGDGVLSEHQLRLLEGTTSNLQKHFMRREAAWRSLAVRMPRRNPFRKLGSHRLVSLLTGIYRS